MPLRTEITIDAPIDAVWGVFSQFKWKAFNNFLDIQRDATGPPAPGEVLNGTFTPPGRGASKLNPTVLSYEPSSHLRWRGKLWNTNLFFVGEHYFEAKPLGNGKTQFVHGEDFKGLLVPLLGGLLRDTEKGFEEFNQGLKRAAEERAAGKS